MDKRIDWFNVGKDHWKDNQNTIKAYCEAIQWHELPYKMAFMPGEAIKTLIKEAHIPNVSHVGDSHEMSPYGLVGIRAHYKNQDVEVFAVDHGTHISPLCAFVYEREVVL